MPRTGCRLFDSFNKVKKQKVSSFCRLNILYNLFVLRLVQSARDITNDGDALPFILRVGTKHGVVTHTFRVETKADLNYWTQAISQCLQNAVVKKKEIVFRMFKIIIFSRKNRCNLRFSRILLACKWNNRTCKLFLHYEHGFTLYSDPTDSVTSVGNSANTGNVRLLWQQPFEKLRSSADDNEHLLTLDFHGEEGVVVR